MDNKRYEEARRRVKEKKEFYKHLTSYVVMSVFFFLLNATTSFGHWWFYWPMLGWGIGIMFHYFDVFGFPGAGNLSDEWEEEAIQEEIKRLESNNRRYREGDIEEDDRLELKELKKERKKWDDDELV